MNSKNITPWLWVPTLYFAEGVPYFIVNNISVMMFTKMGVPNGDMAFFTTLLYFPWFLKGIWSPLVDVVNAKYVMNENSYSLAGLTDSNGNVTGVDMTKSVNFSTPKMTLSSGTVTVTTTRTGSYTLTATNQNGELISIECTGDSETCQNIGMEKNSSGKYVLPL